MRSPSDKCAIERIDTRGFPFSPYKRRPTSSGSPAVQAAKLGEAIKLLSCIANVKRSLAG